MPDQHEVAATTDNVQAVSEGALWRRVDLHLHTPGVPSFKHPPGVDLRLPATREHLADLYVQQLADQGIGIAALTDYNGVRAEWFEAICTRAAAAGITVFPGAEVSFRSGKYGLHLLAVFPLATDPEESNRFLGSIALDRAARLVDPATGVHRDIEPADNLFTVVRALRERFHCLIIVPHADDDNGLARTMNPEDAARHLQGWAPDALDHCADRVVTRLRSTAVLPADFFDNLAFVEFSDNHTIAEIGTKQCAGGLARATYLKLSATDLDAVRLALHDPRTRRAVGVVPVPAHVRITGLDVTGSGFLGNLSIRWNDDLNVVIGGRGAGKSAVIEVLRYVLDIDPYADASYRNDLVWHALGSGGKATVTVERPTGSSGSRSYRITRVRGEAARITEAESGSSVEAKPLEVFGPANEPMILGQREIQSVSADEAYRLRLLDDLIGDEAKRAARDVARVREALDANARAIIDVGQRLARRAEREDRLRAIDHEIGVYEAEGVAEKLQTQTGLSSDSRLLQEAEQQLTEQRDAWQKWRAEVVLALKSTASRLHAAKSIHASLVKSAGDDVQQVASDVERMLDGGLSTLAACLERLIETRRQWQELLRPIEDDLLRVRRELRSDALDPDRLIQLTEERTGLVPQVDRLKALAEQAEALHRDRKKLVDEFREVRHREHVIRREQCSAVETRLRGRVRVSIVFKGQKEGYRRELTALLRGSRVSEDAVQRLVSPEATDGASLAEAVRGGVIQVEGAFGISRAMAQRAVEWLSSEDRLLSLEVLCPADSVRIELVVDGQPRALDRLSIGQRATAVLLLLFALRHRPLVLDQPEDDLDNRFVYEDVVALLREEKGLSEPTRRRQIIAATHNANIPVLGDAELVLALDAGEGRCQVVSRASIDDARTRAHIKSVLEGGDEAFRRRAEKYGGMS